MILHPAKKSPHKQPDLTPLINIIFLILIFFMLAGSIKAVDLVQAANLESETGIDEELLLVAITRGGIVQIEGLPVADDMLVAALKNHRNSDRRIGLKPDARLAAERLVEVTVLVRQAGYTELTLITRKP